MGATFDPEPCPSLQRRCNMPSAAETKKARRLVQDIILAQKNTYIKELLRSHKVATGSTKADFEERLYDAIADGVITLEHLGEWVEETEGWGDEHVYLYRVPKTISAEVASDALKCVRRGGLEGLWNAAPSISFPAKRKLTGISFSDGELRFVWHQGATLQERAPERDIEPRDEEDGETYSYKAYRHFGKRTVTRIVVRPASRLAAVFLPGSSEPAGHSVERDELAAEIAKSFRLAQCELCSVATAIPKIEKDVIKAAIPLQTRHTRLDDASGAGWVEFGSSGKNSYVQSPSLLAVRSAVDDDKFKGNGANFVFQMAQEPKPRDVRVTLYADYQRIRVFVKLSRTEVWQILDLISKYV